LLREEGSRLMNSMLRFALLTLLASVALTGPASAANPHLLGEPSSEEVGTTDLLVSGTIAGLGQGTTSTILVDADGLATVTCTNPSGRIVAAQTDNFDASGEQTAIPDRNGRYEFSILLSPVLEGNPCPNARWTPTIASVDYSSYDIFVDGSLIGGGTV
jgi:ABC-type amino acid transport substrate-binding protein